MKYRKIGNQLEISELGFGGIPILSGPFDIMPSHFNLDKNYTSKLLLAAYQIGINFFDTAVKEEYGDSERKIGHAFRGIRKNVILSSKARAYSKEKMQLAILSSLKELNTDYIDIYGIHQLSPNNKGTALNEEFGAINALREAKEKGKIRSISVGTHWASIAAEISKIDDIDMIQLPYNPLEYGLFETARSKGLNLEKVVFHKVLGAGVLTSFASVGQLIQRALSEKPKSILIGIGTNNQLDELSQAYFNESQEIGNFYIPHSECNRCQNCNCPKGLSISHLLRYRAYAFLGYYRWALSKFKRKYHVECDLCGDCLDTCPRGVNIPALIKEIEAWLYDLESSGGDK